jgi:hypothetical protein
LLQQAIATISKMTHDMGPVALNAPSHIPATGPVRPLEPPPGSIPLEQQAAPNAPGHTPAPTPEPPTANIALEEHVISASAPPISTTKGSSKRNATGGDVPAPHFKRSKQSSHVRRCSKCNKLGHYSTSCGRDAPPPKRPRGRPVGSGKQKTTV